MFDDKNILKLKVNGEDRQYDPMPFVRRYRSAVKRVTQDVFSEGIQTILQGEGTQQLAEVIMPVVYETIGFKPFDHDQVNGLIEVEALNVFTQFIDWLVDSKKKDESSPSSAGPAGGSEEIPVTPSIAPLSSAETSSNPEGLGSLALVAV